MSIAITPSATPGFVSPAAGLSVPVNGDALDATFMKTSVEQPLLDATEAARLNILGGGMRRRVLGSSATSLTIQPLGAVTVETAPGIWTTVAMTVAATIDPTTVFGAAFAADTRYWLYATISAGVIAWHISTTAPDAMLHFKTGDTSKLYVSTFITRDAGVFVAYKQSDNCYTYVDFTTGVVHGNKVLSYGTSTVATTVAISPLAVPFGASEAFCFAQAVGGVGSWATVFPGTTGMYCGKSWPAGVSDKIFTFKVSGTTATPGESFTYLVDAMTTSLDVWVQSFVL